MSCALCWMRRPDRGIGPRGLARRAAWWLLWYWLLAGTPLARAQNEPGLVVQLPSVSVFSVLTTVNAPDSGAAYLGGLGQGAVGQAYLGSPLLPWAQRASGGVRRHQSLVVRATVQDLESLDEAVLQQAARLAMQGSGPPVGGAVATSTAERPVASLAELRRRKAALAALHQREARAMYERGREALEQGKLHAARAWWRMAACRARGAMRAEILDQLDLLADRAASAP